MKPAFLLLAFAILSSAQTATFNSIEARKLLRQPVLSVMNKATPGPSNDKHDYVSYAPYWWPDPTKPDGLPYIRKDGQTNRTLVAEGDAGNYSSTSRTIRQLAAAFVANGEQIYADNAILRIRAWFLDPATHMNPHVNFGQIVKGRNEGRGAGLITMRAMIDILDAADDLRKKKAMPVADSHGLHDWMDEYHRWLTTSPIGLEEAAAKNNHGSWYAAEAMRIEVYLGMKAQATKRAEALKQRIAWQFEPDGTQPLEAAREDDFSYSVFNLEALANAAMIAKPLGVNLWKFKTADGRSMRNAFQYLEPYAAGSKPWAGKELKAIPKDALAKVRELYDRANP